MPHFKYNSTYVDMNNSDNTALLRVGIQKKGKYVFGLDQMDSKFFKLYGYSYSAFRVLIGRMTKNQGIVFVDGKYSWERNIFFVMSDLDAGDYVIFVQAYWYDKDMQ